MFVSLRSLICVLAVTFIASCAVATSDDASDTDQLAQVPCNGHLELCGRSLADVVFPTTHNSFSSSQHFTAGFSNQNRDIAQQLADGIRGLMLDTYWHKPLFKSARAALCHGNCTVGGYLDLVPELAKVRTFLAAHPHEVIMLFIEQHSLTPNQFAASLSSAGLLNQVYTHPSPAAAWPTLGQLIANGRRVVVFYWTDGTDLAHPAWYHRMRDEFWETPYKYTSVGQFACNKDRGGPNAQLYFVNHFLSNPAGWESLAKQANPWNVVLDHVSDCESQVQLPNAIAVDFYEQDGNPSDGVHSVVRSADYLNGV
jgi:hypothetical protein